MDLHIETAPGDNGAVKIVLQGNLSIRHATAIKEALVQNSGAGKSLQLVLEAVTSLDLAVIQLLYAAKKANANSTVVIKELPPTILELIERAGLERLLH